MSINKETVEYVANLSRIELNKSELETLSLQLNAILDFIDKLKRADISNVQPTSHILPVNNVLRPDSLKPSLPINETLKNAPLKKENFFVVPKVIE